MGTARPAGASSDHGSVDVTRTAFVSLAAAAVALLLAGCGGGNEPELIEVPGLPGSLVDVGDHLLYLNCAGKGGPTVILEAGFGGDSQLWGDVQPSAAPLTRVCSYDRAGLGASPRPEVERTRTTQTEVDDLERLLDRAEIEAPYVLVGHSHGGSIARLFAGQHRDEVAGIVLVDSAHPDFDSWVGEAVARRVGGDPAGRRLRAAFRLPRILAGLDLRASAAQVRAVRSLGAVPLVVLTANRRDWLTNDPNVAVPDDLAAEIQGLWLAAQRELAGLSSNRVHGVALESDHFIQSRIRGQPQIVVAAIEAVLRAARGDTRLPACRRLFSRTEVACVATA
jgi:pimeloyl-ACP methyl ester carboxylesterase